MAPARDTIVQICPRIGPGTGVGGVAHHLELEFRTMGLDVRRITLAETGGAWTLSLKGRIGTLVQVIWFSTVGTVVARRRLRQMPGAMSICHNDALAGDIYVNHGIVQAAMRARGHYRLRLIRNPLHLFTIARDRYRYTRSSAHRLVVSLGNRERALLADTYGDLTAPQTVIGNGVDIEAFRPAAPAARVTSRRALGLGADDVAVLFVGHEFGRKGLPALVEALTLLPEHVHLFVVGGTPPMIESEQSTPAAQRLGARLHFVGQGDPQPWYALADVFALPSAYEAHPLVVLEALASGVPVVATATGAVPDVVVDGANGFLASADAADLARALQRVLDGDRPAMAAAARREAERHSWRVVAEQYLAALRGLRAGPGARS